MCALLAARERNSPSCPSAPLESRVVCHQRNRDNTYYEGVIVGNPSDFVQGFEVQFGLNSLSVACVDNDTVPLSSPGRSAALGKGTFVTRRYIYIYIY